MPEIVYSEKFILGRSFEGSSSQLSHWFGDESKVLPHAGEQSEGGHRGGRVPVT